MKLASKTKTISAQWLALLTIFGMAVFLVPVFAQGQTIARDDSTITPPNTDVTINVVANDTAGSGNLKLNEIVNSPAANGTVDNHLNGTFTYTPNPDFTSTDPDIFEYTVCDDTTPNPEDACATATVYVYVGTEITTFNIIPKKLNVKKMGVIPIVIRSTEGFDVTKIDPTTLTLEGAPLSHFHMGKKKLTVKFKAQDIVGPIRDDDDISHGDGLLLHLTGMLTHDDPLLEDSPFVGEDTVIIITKGKQN